MNKFERRKKEEIEEKNVGKEWKESQRKVKSKANRGAVDEEN